MDIEIKVNIRYLIYKNKKLMTKKENVDLYGKVAKFPGNVTSKKAYSFLENIKINKNKVWYILTEKQSNQLQMIKYNQKKGVELDKFFEELKNYYLYNLEENSEMYKIIENLEISGENKFVTIKNIPNVEFKNNKTLLTVLTEDLIRLLSK